MCGRDDAQRQPVGDAVIVFCCDHCQTGVIRTFAAHDPSEDDEAAATG